MTTVVEAGAAIEHEIRASDVLGVFEDVNEATAVPKPARIRIRYVIGPVDPVAVAARASAIKVADVKTVVARMSDIEVADIDGHCRQRRFSWPRQRAMYLARKLTSASYPQIGATMGGKDHTSCLFAFRKIARLRLVDAALDARLTAEEAAIRASRPVVTAIEIPAGVPGNPQLSNVGPANHDRVRAMVSSGFLAAIRTEGTVQ